METLVDLIFSPSDDEWPDRAKQAFDTLFGSGGGRYRKHAAKTVKARVPSNVSPPFAALIHPSNPDSGAYGGMSFVVFPQEDGADGFAPAMFGLVLGTQGLSPDQKILGRPGHARKSQAIAKWLNAEFGDGEVVAWAKDDPVRTDRDIPQHVQTQFPQFSKVFDKYGGEVYAFFSPPDSTDSSRNAVDQALKAFLDLMFEERGETPLSTPLREAERIRRDYGSYFFPDLATVELANTLDERRYAIVQGPPGTGKTRLALQLIDGRYDGNGTTIQFHPNTTYEDVVGGLAPVKTEDSTGFGFRFEPQKGALMRAAQRARQIAPAPYLLHIDEINRADLSSVLGEAVFLLEPDRNHDQAIELPHDFGAPFGTHLTLPDNLHILGTMNTSDRSIAILDVAIRRRFAFLKLWPQLEVVTEYGCQLAEDKFEELQSIFIEHASRDAFNLLPGHSYFLESDRERARRKLRQELVPLLEEYIAQGYVAGFEGEIRSYIQSVESL